MRLSTDYTLCVQQLMLNLDNAESIDIAVEVIRDWIDEKHLDRELVGWDVENDLPMSNSFFDLPINWIEGKTQYLVTLNLRSTASVDEKEEIKRFNERVEETLLLSAKTIRLAQQHSSSVFLEQVAKNKINRNIENIKNALTTEESNLELICTEERLLFLQIACKYMERLVEIHSDFQKKVTNISDRFDIEIDGLL